MSNHLLNEKIESNIKQKKVLENDLNQEKSGFKSLFGMLKNGF